MNSPAPLVVLKFGGTSVSSPDRWATILRIVRERVDAGERVLVVQSTIRGVTDRLQALPDQAIAGDAEAVSESLLAIRTLHTELAAGLGLPVVMGLEQDLTELEALAASLLNGDPVTPALRAEILAFGERISSRVGAAALQTTGMDVAWLDARNLLTSVPLDGDHPRRWLSAECSSEVDPDLSSSFNHWPHVSVTQGFTACDSNGDTVVLGRGGSDTAAAYLAGKLDASRLEIWSDVPGMFTADPRLVPGARLLRTLDYREAQEIATTGSAVLHPRCIPALRDRGIPIHLKSTLHPHVEGTVIAATGGAGPAQVKAISRKLDVVLISMSTVGMWHEVGFLARAFGVIANAGLSIDLVSTSETNVTVSLDTRANLLDEETLDRVVDELSGLAKIRIIRPCAAVSLVGSRIRGLLHRLGPALQVFEEHQIRLVTQAASDLNLTVVVDEPQAERLVRQLHALLVPETADPKVFGPRWQEIGYASPATQHAGSVGLLDGADGPGVMAGDGSARPAGPWWEHRRDELLAIGARESAAYVYDLPTISGQMQRLMAIEPVDRVFFAMKANSNPDILRQVRADGGGFECVSPGELNRVFGLFDDLSPDEVLFTPNFAPREEIADALERGVHVTLDSLYPLREWGDLFAGREVLVRVDPGWGSGHHEKVVTGGEHAKFGIPLFELDELVARTAELGVKVIGVHTHSGSGILDAGHWSTIARTLTRLIPALPDVRIVNVGGGLGIPERPGQPSLDMAALAAGLTTVRESHPDVEFWIEPGRFVVAEAGVLLAKVNQVKGKAETRYVGVATGMNSLIRPALYGAYHHIINLTRLGEPAVGNTQVVGPICESGDRLGNDRALPETREGDILLIDTAGAYGYVMSSNFNLRAPAVEVALI